LTQNNQGCNPSHAAAILIGSGTSPSIISNLIYFGYYSATHRLLEKKTTTTSTTKCSSKAAKCASTHDLFSKNQ